MAWPQNGWAIKGVLTEALSPLFEPQSRAFGLRGVLETILKPAKVMTHTGFVHWPENGEEGVGTLKSCIFKRRLEMKRWSRQIRRRTLPIFSGEGVAVFPRIRDPHLFFPFMDPFGHCHADCQWSWSRLVCHGAQRLDYNEG